MRRFFISPVGEAIARANAPLPPTGGTLDIKTPLNPPILGDFNRSYSPRIGGWQTVKNKALLLWKYLSQLLNTKVNKQNMREVLAFQNFGGIFSPTSNSVAAADLHAHAGGRSIELFQLRQWIETDRHKSIFIYGMKGIGKSYIAQKIAELLAPNLDYLVWIPLERPTPLIDLLSIIIKRIGAWH
jgi:predicted GTPase